MTTIAERIETATKTLGIPVLATREFAEAAPGAWETCGNITITDLDRELDVFTLPEILPVTPVTDIVRVEPAE